MAENSNTQSSVLTKEERERLDENLAIMEKNVWLTYKSHFNSSQYYHQLARVIDVLVTGVIPASAAGLAFSMPFKRRGIAASTLGLVFGSLQRFDTSQYHPAKLHEKHFSAGIKLSSFHSEVMVFRQLRMKDSYLTKKQFMDEYQGLIDKKMQYDEIIKTDTWAYSKARESVHHFEKLWESQKKEKQDSE